MIYLLKEYANEDFDVAKVMDNLQPLLLNNSNGGADCYRNFDRITNRADGVLSVSPYIFIRKTQIFSPSLASRDIILS